MGKLIAIPRKSVPDPAPAALALDSVGVRRHRLFSPSAETAADDSLLSLGISHSLTASTEPVPRGSYKRLEKLGAYIIDPSSRIRSEAVKEALDPDFIVVPNIILSMPEPILGKAQTRLGKKDRLWPEESGIAEAHRNGIRGQGVILGVLDTGCDVDHRELRRKRVEFRYVPFSSSTDLRTTRGFDVHGHGTHVCGILAGERVGIAPEADLLVASVIESETLKTSLERITRALDWMLTQMQNERHEDKPAIVNLSLGFQPESVKKHELQGLAEGIRKIINDLAYLDVLLVVAIGNEGPGRMRIPGTFEEVLAVGAVDFEKKPWHRSGGGKLPGGDRSKPDIAGYGVGIMSSFERSIENRSLYTGMSGTSMATPYVAGIAALYASSSPDLRGARLREHLVARALHLDEPEVRVGAGLARFD
jgi:subtilisin family serine protease